MTWSQTLQYLVLGLGGLAGLGILSGITTETVKKLRQTSAEYYDRLAKSQSQYELLSLKLDTQTEMKFSQAMLDAGIEIENIDAILNALRENNLVILEKSTPGIE